MNSGVSGPPAFGWLGTGRMGSALAARLLCTGESVMVWNRTASKTDVLVAAGATAVAEICDLGAARVVFTCVSASADLAAVLLEPGGLLTGTNLPEVIVDCSTVSAEVSAQVREAAERVGVAFLAAPVSGNAHVVASGESCLIVSGPPSAYDRLLPTLNKMAQYTVWVGPAEQSRLVKLCLNLFLGMTVQALVEVITLAEKGGTERQDFLSVLNATMVTTEWIKRRTPALEARDWTPTFTTELLRKDFDLGLAAARTLEVPMEIGSAVQQVIAVAIGQGLRDVDFLSLYDLQAAVSRLPQDGHK